MPDTVVITRPGLQGQAWLDAFVEQDIPAIYFPLLQIEPIKPNTELIKARASLHQWSWIMFVSSNAVTHFFNGLSKDWPQHWPSHLRVGATGKGTAKALLEAGIAPQQIDQPQEAQPQDTEHLWAHICHRNWKNTQVLLVRGENADCLRPNRDWFLQVLQQAGAHVQALPVYYRAAPKWTDKQIAWLSSQQAQQACWILTSAQGISYLPTQDWSKAIALVTHPRIGEAARAAGFVKIIYTQPQLQVALDSVQYIIRDPSGALAHCPAPLLSDDL